MQNNKKGKGSRRDLLLTVPGKGVFRIPRRGVRTDHPDRFITVISGTWWVGAGNKFDPNSTAPMPAGSFVTRYGKQVHYDGAKDQEVTLEIGR